MAVEWDVEQLITDIRSAAAESAVLGAEVVLGEAVRSILQDPKTGRVYKRGSIEHQASAPGESPANDTGRLAQSGHVEADAQNIAADVVFSTEYAAAMEFGRLDGHILPRPYARPALLKKQADVQKLIDNKIAQAIARSRK